MNTEQKLSVEDLMKPRYKVIADYPDSYYGTGDILYPMGSWNEKFMDKYPHLFKKLQWWEERRESEMPEYVKWASGQKEIIKVDKHFTSSFNPPTETKYGCRIYDAFFSYRRLLPATKEEYENQKQKIIY